MRTSFAIALVAALASAQDEYWSYDDVTGEYTETTYDNSTAPLSGLFELNDEGRWALNIPQIPEISFEDIDDQIVIDWAENRQVEYDEVNQGYADAWNDYVNGVMGPWNDLVNEVKQLESESTELDLQTSEDIINFVADNTFVEGASLRDTYPEIEDILVQMRNVTATYDEKMNWDEIYLTPVTLQSYYEYEEVEEEPRCPLGEKIRETLVNNGFDAAVVEEWLTNSGASWQELNKEHQAAEVQLAQAQLAEANQYVKSILDSMVANLREMQVSNQAEFEASLDAKIAEMKAETDAQALEAIDQLSSWLESSLAEVEEFTQADIEALVEEAIQEAQEPEEPAPAVSLLAEEPIMQVQPSNNNMAYGCGALALGAIFAMGYFYKKNKPVKVAMPEAEEKLVDEDEQFQQV